jgi:pyruvate/2-oxoglutarate dehydrogenase complex dihydrolipoamide acyltransferase (E2) component
VPDFAIRIPRVGIAVSEATLVEKLAEDGQQVSEGDPLFTVGTDKVETEVPAGASGTVSWTGEVDTTYDIAAEIGVIRTSD